MRHILLVATATAAILSPAMAPRAMAEELPTLRIGLADDADLLDPTVARTFVGRIVFAGLCDKLFDINEKLEIVPQLATGYEWADSKTLIINLRSGVTFHDGTPMDAAAVKYSLERHLTMQGSSRRGEIAGMERVEVVNPTTVRIVLKAPSAPFLSQLTDRAGMIVSPKAAEAAGKDFALHPVCAGPFKFTERVPQDRIVLDRFPGYWNAPAIQLGRIVYRPIPDSSVRLANLQAGALDMAERIAPNDVETVRKDPKLKITMYDGLGYQSINLNIAHGPRAQTPLGQDARVRKAFELSIDREALVQVVYNGMFTPVAQAVPPASPFYAPDVKPRPRDVAEAKRLLKEAGVKLPVTVTLTVANMPDTRQTGEVIQSMATEAGFDVKIQSVEFASGLDAADRGDFEAYLVGWSGRADADGNLWNFLHTGAPLNYPGYSNKDVDTWLEQARGVTDVAARRALYAKVAAQSAQDLSIMYLYIPKTIVGMSAKLAGFKPVPDGILRPQGMTLQK
ncbi:ABC transporter substrate-binding protein [Limobrevibacterium gyesilva]|uniref:ABC transporter substrate-binding protein n=1 Tax=Limobrevibacterium gyesilva TaxID=2991712 RepID=A0AA41YKR0_9PROT|nr:ABC transporter substrate-binding protein [Limobrevibacterium gyesilva]MCW3474007.1 ABC transporter substrate-binding protein [Limobrevibacterium gyesilva]